MLAAVAVVDVDENADRERDDLDYSLGQVFAQALGRLGTQRRNSEDRHVPIEQKRSDGARNVSASRGRSPAVAPYDDPQTHDQVFGRSWPS